MDQDPLGMQPVSCHTFQIYSWSIYLLICTYQPRRVLLWGRHLPRVVLRAFEVSLFFLQLLCRGIKTWILKKQMVSFFLFKQNCVVYSENSIITWKLNFSFESRSNVVQASLNCAIALPLSSWCLDYRHALSHSALVQNFLAAEMGWKESGVDWTLQLSVR